MYNLIRADIYKLRKSMTIKILFGITTVSAVIMAVMAYLIPQGKIDASMTGIGFMFGDTNMINILGAVMAGIFICGDFDNKTIHDAIANGFSRGTIIVSKTTVFSCAIGFILLPYAIITVIAISTGSKFSMGSAVLGLLHLLTSEAGTVFSVSGIWKLLAVILTLMIVYVAQLSICVPLAFVLKKPILVVAINYGFSIFCAQLMGLRGNSPLFDHIFACTPYGGNYAFTTLDTGTGDIFKAIFVSLIFIIVMISITYSIYGNIEVRLLVMENAIISFKNPVKNTSEIDVERLFDRFHTGDKARSNTTGLGLSIVRLLAQQMGGSAGGKFQNGLIDIQVRLPLFKDK